MKKDMVIKIVLSIFLPSMLLAQGSWQEITVPPVREVASAFRKPPREYGNIHWAIWGGQQSKERVLADIEQLDANGTYIVMINNSRGLRPKYFSPEYLDLVKFTVDECKKRGMKVWIEDDGGYPSGFAGGIISKDYPDLGMQGIVADARYTVAAGQTLNIPLPPDTLGILVNPLVGVRVSGAAALARPSTVLPLPVDGQFQWTAPGTGMWEVTFVRHVFRSSPTRYTNREDGTSDKDSLYSLIDYLNPEATRTYLKVIHEVYEKLVGDEFGKTILGFRGDEPDYTGFMPWTPKLLEEFRKVKGYDLQPYLALFFASELTEEARRAKADYWDLWSGMFRDNFYKPQADWCKARNMEYMTHLNHEEMMLDLARGEDLIRNQGDLFRCLQYAQVPGIDNLGQIGPGRVTDFPKLASSVAHMFGRPKIWTEQGGSTGRNGKFVTDYQLVRGINYLQIRGLIGRGRSTTSTEQSAQISALNSMTTWYVNRASYLLAIGRPAAQVAMYFPTSSMWLGDEESDRSTVQLTQQLLEHQIDFDYIDEQALTSVVALDDGGLKNLSGQVYRGVVIPSTTAISRAALERLRAFANSGGKVVFVGRTPAMVVERTFLEPAGAEPDLSFAVVEPSGQITPRVVRALPKPDVVLDSPCPAVKYTRRSYLDAEIYFFFNESDEKQSRTATLAGRGQAQVWDAGTGLIHPMTGASAIGDSVQLHLVLEPYEAKFIVIGPLPSDVAAPEPSLVSGETILEIAGDWTVDIDGKKLTTELKSWEDMGISSYSGAAFYRKEFSAPAARAAGRQRLHLECDNVRDFARVRLNGLDLEARAWPPYRWEVTETLKSGTNVLEIEVRGGGGGAGSRRGGATEPSVSGLLAPVRLVRYR